MTLALTKKVKAKGSLTFEWGKVGVSISPIWYVPVKKNKNKKKCDCTREDAVFQKEHNRMIVWLLSLLFLI